MTTVVFKDGVFAADSLITSGGTVEGYCKKITRCENVYVGWAGSLQAATLFKDYLSGKDIDKSFFDKPQQEFSAIVADSANRQVITYTNGLIPEIYNAPFYCIGSGTSIAKGALMAGATPREAVKVAASLDIYTGGKIQTVKVW